MIGLGRRRPRVAAAGAMAMILAIAGGGTALADDELIVYEVSGSIWAIPAAGGTPERIGPSTSYRPRLSPDGTTVLAWGRSSGQQQGLWLFGSDGSDPRHVLGTDQVSLGVLSHAAWSPDGERIAWARPDARIRFATVEGEILGTVQVCTGLGWQIPILDAFDWARDGTLWVACRNGAPGTDSGNHLRVVPETGGKGVRKYRGIYGAQWLRVDAAGERAIICCSLTAGNPLGVFVVGPGGASPAPTDSWVFAWSPDGRRMVGWSDELFTVAAGGGGIQGLGAPGGRPDWGPIPPVCGAGFEPSNGGKLIIGTPGDDLLEGTPGNDVICGLGGSDDIYGFGGDDWIDGGPGNDRLYAGDGDDVVLGGGGRDFLDGGDGFDTMDGGPGNDILMGRQGPDHLFGGDGDDELRGGPGDDLLSGGGGKDLLIGDAGDDRLSGGADADTLVGDDLAGDVTGADVLEGGDGDDTLLGGRGDDELYGQGGDDSLFGEDGDDLLLGGDGDDVLRGGPGRDRLSGGKGSDTLKGGPGNDHLTGGPRKDRLEGEGGSDTLIARDGIRDIVRGGPGSDKARIDPGLDDVTGVETLLP